MWSLQGYTTRLPVRLESWSSSMLLLGWGEKRGGPGVPSISPIHPRVSLYRPLLGSYTLEHQETARTHQLHQFTDLQPCSQYAACLELQARTRTCISTLTGEKVWGGEPVVQCLEVISISGVWRF